MGPDKAVMHVSTALRRREEVDDDLPAFVFGDTGELTGFAESACVGGVMLHL